MPTPAPRHRTISLDKLARQYGGEVSAGEFIPPDDLVKARAERIALLWQAASAHADRYFSGGVYAQMYQLETLGSAMAKANHKWVFKLWRLYYSRKDEINASHAVAEVNSISLDFAGVVGAPPYTVAQIMGECARLLPDLLT